jgi:hypothetical protein
MRIDPLLTLSGDYTQMITSDRDQFLGIHVTYETKLALRRAADKRGISMSQLAYEILTKQLGGHNVRGDSVQTSGHQLRTTGE